MSNRSLSAVVLLLVLATSWAAHGYVVGSDELRSQRLDAERLVEPQAPSPRVAASQPPASSLPIPAPAPVALSAPPPAAPCGAELELEVEMTEGDAAMGPESRCSRASRCDVSRSRASRTLAPEIGQVALPLDEPGR